MSHLSRTRYTYNPRQRYGIGWDLFDGIDWPNIQRIDETEAFDSDADAAFHVLCAAAFDGGPEGEAARNALRALIAFGEKGLNPIATVVEEPSHE